MITIVTKPLYKPESHIYSGSLLDNGSKPENGTNGLGYIVKKALSTKRNYEYELPEWFPDDLTGKEDPIEIVVATYHRFNRLIRTVAARTLSNFDLADAENVEQNVYINLLRGYKKYTPGRDFTTWLEAVAKNAAIDYARAAVSRGQDKEDSLDENQTGNRAEYEESISPTTRIEKITDATLEYDPERSAMVSEGIMLLNQAISLLPEEQQLVINEHVIGDLTHVEVSERDGIKENTLKSRTRYGLQKIREFMDKRGLTIDSFVD